ncbi:MAG: hypothetical protein A2075_11540 [Geobacteraceae bacterium GWC2_58_44]|nr:MAG: hypothetical protein A2075_11540 [Geobacteraceae bacterium GWC2_58_44]HBG04817.1 hypothetical protein [Geobacter sp.]
MCLRSLELKGICILTLLCVTLLLLGIPFLPAADASRQELKAAPLPLRLEVDAERRGRAFYGGLQTIVSIGAALHFVEPAPLGGDRKRIFSGPWNGDLRQGLPGSHTLSGRDAKSGAEYLILIRQVDAGNLKVDFSFTAPSRPADLSFDILKLSGDLFAGAGLESLPQALHDAGEVPTKPSPAARRIMLTGKNRVRVRGALCDIEVTDLLGSSSILVADCRLVPWDREKSINFNVDSISLDPGRSYQFSYSVRSLPPSRTSLIRNDRAVGSPVPAGDQGAGFGAAPKYMLQAPGFFQLQGDTVICGNPRGSAERVLAAELRRQASLQCEVVAPGSSGFGRGIRIEQQALSAKDKLPPEGYELSVNRDGVVIRGADARGCLYGAHALLNRLLPVQGGWRVASGTRRDWPDLPQRGACIEMSPALRDVALFKRYLDAISRSGGNLVIFLHDPIRVAGWRKGAGNKGWTPEQLAEIAAYARFLQLEVWAGIGSAFKSADFPGLSVAKGANFYDPSQEGSYRLLFGLYDQLLAVYQPSTLLISHDEMRGLSSYAAAMKSSEADIFARDVTRSRNWLAERGVATAIWGDMLLDHGRWEKEVGAANSSNPFFSSGATHEALDQLPRDVVILDWHYDMRKQYRSVEHFRSRGFRVLGASWHDPQAARSLALSVKQFGGQGIIATDWGLLRTMAPAATTLSAPLCGWSSQCSGEGNGDLEFLAGYLRDRDFQVSTYRQSPVALGEAANRSTWDAVQGSGRGIFDVGPVLDLRALASGWQSFAGVMFDVDSPGRGKRNNCIVAAGKVGAGELPADSVTLPGAAPPVRAIAFLHTAFVAEPQVALRELGEYLIEYQSGRKVRVPLQENWNITDLRCTESLRRNPWTFSRSPDVLAGSRPGWRGYSASGIPLNAQMFIWQNPFPEEKISRLTLRGSGSVPHSRVALLGVTLLQ